MKDLSLLKKTICIMLAVLFAVSMCSCAKDTEEETQPEETAPTLTLTVEYSQADGLNPFTMTDSDNERLVSLMYRSLYYLSTDYDVVNDLAADQAVTGPTIEVALKDEKFCDGIAVKAEDVVYSFEKAKESTFYGGVLEDVTSCEEKNPTTVVFTLTDRNVNAAMKLTFPIVRSGTAEKETSKPSGCGPYMFSVSCLVPNPYYDGKVAAAQINLVNKEDGTSATQMLDEGKTDFCYTDLSEGETIQTSSPSVPVYINNLVYIGLNSAGDLGSTNLRKAVSAAIDRRTIADSALQGNARPACVPFNTSWIRYSETETAKTVKDISDKPLAEELLETLGIGVKNEETGEVKTANLTLIYPDSNQYMFQVAKLIQTQLAGVNINVTVTPVESDSYLETIDGSGWDMYVGEISIRDDMDITQLMSTYGNAAYGISYYSLSCDEYYTDYVQGDVTMDEFLQKFLEEQPFIPVAYRNGRFYYNSEIKVGVVTQNRLYCDINDTLAAAEAETVTETAEITDLPETTEYDTTETD